MSQNSQLKLLQNYQDWKAEKQLVPPTWSPEEYMEHLQNEQNAKRIEKAIEMIDEYNMGIDWQKEMVDSLRAILAGEE